MKNKYVDIKGVKLIFAKCKELIASSSGTGDTEDKAKLMTSNKTSLVDAINEVYDSIFKVGYDMSAWQDSVTPGDFTISAFAVARDGTLVVGSGGYGIKYSEDKGKTWQDSDITFGNYKAFAIANDGTLVVGSYTDIGIKYSTDNGKTWQDSNITSGNYFAFAVARDGTLVAGNANLGIKYSTDNGRTWQDSNNDNGVGYTILAVANDGTLVACNNDNAVGIKYSTDNGRTWQDSTITSDAYAAFAIANDGTLVVGSNSDSGIKYSTDNGRTWQNSNTTVGDYLTFAIANDGTLVAGSRNSGIKYSIDNGKTWQDSNMTSGYYQAFAVADDGTLVAGGGGFGIKYSTDNGRTWQDSNITEESFTVFAFTVADDGTLVAGNSGFGIKYCSVTKTPKWQGNSDSDGGVLYYWTSNGIQNRMYLDVSTSPNSQSELKSIKYLIGERDGSIKTLDIPVDNATYERISDTKFSLVYPSDNPEDEPMVITYTRDSTQDIILR